MGAFDDLIPQKSTGAFDDLIPKQDAPTGQLGAGGQPLTPSQVSGLEQAREAQQRAVLGPRAEIPGPSIARKEAQAIADLRATAPKAQVFARDLEEIGAAPELRELNLESAKRGIAAGLITNEAELANAIKELTPGAEVLQDPEGKALVKFPGGKTFAVNKPGLSGQDFVQFATRLVSFIPAGRITGLGTRQLAKGAGAAAATEAGLQAAEVGVEGEFNPEQVAIAGVAAPVGQALGEGVVEPAAKKIIKSFKEVGSKKLLSEAAPSIDTLKASARSIYDQIDESGAVIKPNIYRNLTKKVVNDLNKEGLDVTERVSDSGTPQALALLNRLQRENPAEISISRLDTLRKAAQGVAASANPTEANLGRVAIDRIDDVIENINPGVLKDAQNIKIAGKEISEAFKDARNFWGRARRAERVELAIDLAENARSGVENGLRQEFNRLAKEIKKGRAKGFSKEELSAINAVAQGDRLRNTVTQLGKLGIPEDQATNTLMLSLLGGFGATQFGGGITGAVATAGAIAVPTVLRRQARILTEGSADLASAVTRSKGNALQIARAYVKTTPKKERNVADLSALLLENADSIPEKAIDNTFIDNAMVVAKAALTTEQSQETE